jgi:hypothetical protein
MHKHERDIDQGRLIRATMATSYSQTGVAPGQPFEKLAARELPIEALDSRRYVTRGGERHYLSGDEEPAEGEIVEYAAPLSRGHRGLADGVIV